MTTQHTLSRPTVVGPGEGAHLHFLNHLATVKVSGSSMSIVEFTAPRGFGPPLHRHDNEDELFVILEGRVALIDGDRRAIAEEGGTVFLPSGVPHGFQIESDLARILTVTTQSGTVATFDQMVTALGVEVAEPTLPQPGPIDPERVASVNADFGIEILGPPPVPLG